MAFNKESEFEEALFKVLFAKTNRMSRAAICTHLTRSASPRDIANQLKKTER